MFSLQGEGGQAAATADAIRRAKSQQQGGTVPVIATLPDQAFLSREEAATLAEAGADGIAVPLGRMDQTAASFSGRTDREAQNPVGSPSRLSTSIVHLFCLATSMVVATAKH